MSEAGVDRTRVKRVWEGRGFHGALWVDPPGRVWRDFIHREDELFMLVHGEVELEMQGRTYRPTIGEEVLIRAGTTHTLKNVGDGLMRFLYAFKRD